jgi:hypothetical protein
MTSCELLNSSTTLFSIWQIDNLFVHQTSFVKINIIKFFMHFNTVCPLQGMMMLMEILEKNRLMSESKGYLDSK